MSKTIPFGRLRQVLADLGFTPMNGSGPPFVFQHQASDTLLFYRDYAPDEPVTGGDLAKTRRFLDERGLLDAEGFERLLEKAPV